MPSYRRNYVPGGTYFFTVVTHGRRPLFADEPARVKFRTAIQEVKDRFPLRLFASVLLPDHFHSVWIMPEGDANYSTRWALIKEKFTRAYLADGGTEGAVSVSRRKHREGAVWQKGFWEYTVRDEDDLIRCVDYIHWNPVKHGYVSRAADWPWSSFRTFVATGDYPESGAKSRWRTSKGRSGSKVRVSGLVGWVEALRGPPKRSPQVHSRGGSRVS